MDGDTGHACDKDQMFLPRPYLVTTGQVNNMFWIVLAHQNTAHGDRARAGTAYSISENDRLPYRFRNPYLHVYRYTRKPKGNYALLFFANGQQLFVTDVLFNDSF